MAAEARAAVAIGEVARDPADPLGLSGEAIQQALELVDEAAYGDVRFTHAVFLAMTPSEVPWRIEAVGRGAGRPIHRLLPTSAAGQPPFGAAGQGGRSLGPLRLARRRVSELSAEGVVQGRSLLRRGPRWLAANLLALALALVAAGGTTLGLAAILPTWSPPAIEAALREGREEEALHLAELWEAGASHRPLRQAWRARVLAHRGELEAARALFAEATAQAPRLSRNPALAWGLVLTLDTKGPGRFLLRQNRSPAVEDALIDATRATPYWLRWNAVATLESFGLDHRIDWVDVYLRDLEHGSSCGVRVRAAQELARLGDPRAIPLLRTARAEGHPAALCNLERVAGDALSTLGAPEP